MRNWGEKRLPATVAVGSRVSRTRVVTTHYLYCCENGGERKRELKKEQKKQWKGKMVDLRERRGEERRVYLEFYFIVSCRDKFQVNASDRENFGTT